MEAVHRYDCECLVCSNEAKQQDLKTYLDAELKRQHDLDGDLEDAWRALRDLKRSHNLDLRRIPYLSIDRSHEINSLYEKLEKQYGPKAKGEG